MKAMILAAGNGTRISRMSDGSCKGMLMMRGKPLIEYSLDNALTIGVSEIVIVISKISESIKSHYGNEYLGVPLSYARQENQKGLVEAIEIGSTFLNGDDFILFLSDEILIDSDYAGMVAMFQNCESGVVVGVMEGASSEMIRKNYDVLISHEGRVSRLVEKPIAPQGTLLGLGNCIFKNHILEYLPKVPINPHRGQKDMTDLIQCAIEAGEKVDYYPLCKGYTNINTPKEFEIAQKLLEAPL